MTSRALLRGACFTLGVVFFLGSSEPGSAEVIHSQAVVEEAAVARIGMAIRKRFMVQMIAKATCFALSKHNPAPNAEQAWLTIEMFDTSNQSLVKGDPSVGLKAETDPGILTAMAEFDVDWATYRAASRQIISGDWHPIPMRQILELNSSVLDQVNDAVDQIIKVHSADISSRRSDASTINIAGRQRMLIQRAAREMCFLSLGIQSDKMRRELTQTVDLFERSLFALENGDADLLVVAPQTAEITAALSEVRAQWTAFRAPLDRAIEGTNPGPEDIALIEQLNQPLFEQSDALVSLYFD